MIVEFAGKTMLSVDVYEMRAKDFAELSREYTFAGALDTPEDYCGPWAVCRILYRVCHPVFDPSINLAAVSADVSEEALVSGNDFLGKGCCVNTVKLNG